MKVFLQAIFGQILLNSYILWRGYHALPAQKKWRVPFILLFVIELLLYLFGYFFHKDLPDYILHPILFICNSWYISSLYIALGLIILDLIRLSNKIYHWYPKFIKNHWKTIKLSLFFLFFIGIAGLMIHAHYKVNNPVVKHVYIHIPKVVKGRDSLRIALMSDLHLGEMIGKKHARRYVSLCNAEHPDLVVIAGDIMDYESRFAEKDHIEEDLRKLNAPLGVYITLGNHEYRANRYAKLRWLKKTGGILLVDSVVMPDSTFYLVGRDDAINTKRSSLHTLMGYIDKTKPIIVVDHQPDHINEIIMNQADLGLHGHTHNGQFWPYPIVMKFIFECPYGYYKKGNSQFYVSSGIGFAGPPYRVGTQSELVILHITFDKEKDSANS